MAERGLMLPDPRIPEGMSVGELLGSFPCHTSGPYTSIWGGSFVVISPLSPLCAFKNLTQVWVREVSAPACVTFSQQ